jgi:hypothetical protein
MNLDLKDVGITLVVGAYVLYGLELLVGVLYRHNLFTALREAKFVSDTGSVAVSLALSFALGMIMESAATFYLRGPGSSLKFFERTMVKQVLDKQTLGVSPLGLEMSGNRLFSLVAGPSLVPIERTICATGAIQATDTVVFQRAVSRLYYHSKNVLYGHPQFSDEMLGVQQRMNFSSAFAGCSAMLLLAFVAMTGERWAATRRKPNAEFIPRLKSAGLIASLFGVITATSLFAYSREAGEYTRRAFGYYSTITVEEDLAQQRSDTLVAEARARTDENCLARIVTAHGGPALTRPNVPVPLTTAAVTAHGLDSAKTR